MFIRFVQPFVLTGIVLFWSLVSSSPISIAIVGFFTICLVASLLYRYFKTGKEEPVEVHVTFQDSDNNGSAHCDSDTMQVSLHEPIMSTFSAKEGTTSDYDSGGSNTSSNESERGVITRHMAGRTRQVSATAGDASSASSVDSHFHSHSHSHAAELGDQLGPRRLLPGGSLSSPGGMSTIQMEEAGRDNVSISDASYPSSVVSE